MRDGSTGRLIEELLCCVERVGSRGVVEDDGHITRWLLLLCQQHRKPTPLRYLDQLATGEGTRAQTGHSSTRR